MQARRREAWRSTGDRICSGAPAAPGVYVLRDTDGQVLYVGKATNVRRRLRTHFAERRWRAIAPALARAAAAEWHIVGSEIEALLTEATLIRELRPIVNVQTGAPDLNTRDIPAALIRDVLVIVPSVEEDSVELLAARVDGGWMLQRTSAKVARCPERERSNLWSSGLGSDAAVTERPRSRAN